MDLLFRLAILLLLLTSCQNREEGIQPVYRNITEAIYGTATVTPREYYTVYPPIAGIIEASFLTEGKTVDQGDQLFKISSNQAELNRKKAQLSLEQAKEGYRGEVAILKEMKDRIQSARTKLHNDSLNHSRQSRLWQQNIGSQQQYEALKLAYETSKNALRELEHAYRRTERELANQVALAKNVLAVSQSNYGDHYVSAAMSGTVYAVFKDLGESVGPQTPVAEIGSTSDFLIKILIDEVDVAKISVGQEVVILLDAYGEEIFTAIIKQVLPLKDVRSQTFTVEAEFVTAPPKLFNGLSGEANIIISQRTNVLTLPSQYITPDDQVRTPAGLQRITPGVADMRYTEIISGITAGDTVYQIE